MGTSRTSGPAGLRPPVPGAHLVVARPDVEAAYARLASALQPEVAAGSCLLLGILLGGAVPLVQIAARMSGDFAIDVCRVGRYGDQVRGGNPEWMWPPRVELRDRHVVLVDDIFDEGVTLDFVAQHCLQRGARRISTAVLVRKEHTRQRAGLTPDHVGLEVGDEYLFGCGMDYQGHWRHLGEIWGLPG